METVGPTERERARREPLRLFEPLEQAGGAAFDELAQLLARLCCAPDAGVCLIDTERVVFVARTTTAPRELPRAGSAFDQLIERDADDLADGERFCCAVRADGQLVGAVTFACDGEPTAAQRRDAAVVARRVEDALAARAWGAERARLRGQLHATRAQLDLISGVACDGVWDVDVGMRSVQLTPRVFDLLGLPNTMGSVPLAAIWAVVHVDDRRGLQRAALRQLREAAPFELDLRCRHARGGWRWYRLRGTNRVGATGDRHIAGSLTDVHDQRRSQEHLLRVSRLLAESQALARVGGWELDLSTQQLFWTAETFRIHETSPSEYTPTVETAIGFYAPVARPQIRAALEESIARGRAFSLELPLITARGRPIWCRATGGAVFSGGRAVRLLGAFQDITAQRRMDADLVAAKEAAEAASESKSAFLAAMSHEIRTPMHTVLGYTDMLRDSALTDEQRECVDIITTSGNSLLRLIDDILDFSKVEAGKMQLERAVVDLRRVVDDVARMLQPQAKKKQLTLDVTSLSDCECRALADPQRVRQVLVNLVGNAVKFTEAGRVELSAECREHCICVRVRDTGIGIPEDQLGRLFEDFVQVDSSTQRRFGGTGLGLAISKQLVAAMGGEVGVESAPGVGSTFWFTLPKADHDARAVADRAPDRSSAPAVVDGAARRVLLAEDNRLNQRLAVRVLETFGYDVDTANDGEEALSLATSRDYDLILMDCLMPGMDGFEATRRIREGEQRSGRHVPIIALTANALPEDREACLESGMDDFVSKPFTRQALRQATERWLRGEA